jgi:hypothetical protein
MTATYSSSLLIAYILTLIAVLGTNSVTKPQKGLQRPLFCWAIEVLSFILPDHAKGTPALLIISDKSRFTLAGSELRAIFQDNG